MEFNNIGIMCGSSEGCERKYLESALRLGINLAEQRKTIIYGGGNKGSMKRVADGALCTDGRVIGIMPKFMKDVEWNHPGLSDFIETSSMSERKNKMLELSDAFIFLPGGSGTLEEFFEFFTAKRLGLFRGPLVIVNQDQYFDPLVQLLDNMFSNKFLNLEHKDMYSVVDNVDLALGAILEAPEWPEDAIDRAGVH